MIKENHRSHKVLSGSKLKKLAIITMLIDHVGAFILEPYILLYNTSALFQQFSTTTRLIGRLSFPLFVFLLVEGFMHTRNLGKYTLRLGLFALISEVPFDLANKGFVLELSYQNIFFTLTLGLLVLTYFQKYQEKGVTSWLVLLFGIFLAELLKADYGAIGVLLIFLFYYFHDDALARNATTAPLLLLQRTAILALVPIYFYSGKRGKQSKVLFYFFYPGHLIFLYLIRLIIFQ